MTRKEESQGTEELPGSLSMDYRRLKEILEDFIGQDLQGYPEELDDLIRDTARTGVVRLPWELLKPLLHYRLEKVINSTFLGQHSENEKLPQQLLDQLNKFDNPPFTVQRVCELIVEPTKFYKKRDFYLRAMEKNLLVVTTQEPDLTWMKSPRLTQLLEEQPRQPVEEMKLSYDPQSENGPLVPKLPEPAKNISSSPPTSTTWTLLTKPSSPSDSVSKTISEPSRCSFAKDVQNSSSSLVLPPPPAFLPPPPPLEALAVSRKRCSSERDSMEEERTVLQEADSTVNIEQPQFENEATSPKKPRNSPEDSDTAFPSLSPSSLVSLLERTLPSVPSSDSKHLETLSERSHVLEERARSHVEERAEDSISASTAAKMDLKQVASEHSDGMDTD